MYDLTKMTTRRLLKLLEESRRYEGGIVKLNNYDDSFYTAKEVKVELAKREHIPNKLEARKIRQDNAKKR